MAVKTHNEVTPFYRHFEPSETFGTDSHQVRNTITVRLTHAQTFFRGVARSRYLKCKTNFEACWNKADQF